jgi:hypothetical protein
MTHSEKCVQHDHRYWHGERDTSQWVNFRRSVHYYSLTELVLSWAAFGDKERDWPPKEPPGPHVKGHMFFTSLTSKVGLYKKYSRNIYMPTVYYI